MPDQHKPGPATNALVAEKVMGWKWAQSCVLKCNYLVPPHEQVSYLPEYLAKNPDWPDERHGFIPAYTTDIAAAWEVHQKMRTRIFSVRQRYYWAIQCVVRQRLNMAGQPLWPDVFGVLKPEDICLAALAVVESEDNHV